MPCFGIQMLHVDRTSSVAFLGPMPSLLTDMAAHATVAAGR